MMSVEAQEANQALDINLVFTKADLRDVVPHDNDPVVISVVYVNAPSAYNILLGTPTLNRLRAVASTRHMKMKLHDLGGKVITIKSDQKEAKRCFENSLKTKRGVHGHHQGTK